MTDRRSEPLLRELARDLPKVRPLPRLRVVAAGAVALWVAVLAVHWLLGGARPQLGGGVPWRAPGFLAMLLGLALTSAGAVISALAGAVPGRDVAERWGRTTALVGALLLLGGGLFGVLMAAAAPDGIPLASILSCATRASALGLLPAIGVCAFLAMAWQRHPTLGAALAVLGAVSLGTLAVHTSCVHGGAFHMLLGHALAPFGAALLLAFPLSLVGRRKDL